MNRYSGAAFGAQPFITLANARGICRKALAKQLQDERAKQSDTIPEPAAQGRNNQPVSRMLRLLR
jgi:hypothetical protein